MVEPISVTREQFPKSLIKADGMQVINPVCDNYELAYYYDVEYAVRGSRKLFLQMNRQQNLIPIQVCRL